MACFRAVAICDYAQAMQAFVAASQAKAEPATAAIKAESGDRVSLKAQERALRQEEGLVVADNCTRQCLGLPLFVVGPKASAELVVEALGMLLPKELQFLISDM